jgi:hypothetical protein
MMHLPIASWPGHSALASADSTTITCGAPLRSASVKPRPRSSRMPIVSKNPGVMM